MKSVMIQCSYAGGSSRQGGQSLTPPHQKQHGAQQAGSRTYSLMFQRKQKVLKPYTPSWHQVLRAVQQCYMPIARASSSTRCSANNNNNNGAADNVGSPTPPSTLREYYDMYLASDDEAGWDRVLHGNPPAQGTSQSGSLLDSGHSASSTPQLVYTFSGTHTSMEEPHGDPQDDELFCIRRDMASRAAKQQQQQQQQEQQQQAQAAADPAAAATPEQQAAQELAQQRACLRRAVQLIQSAWDDEPPRTAPRSASRTTPPRTSPTGTFSPATSPASFLSTSSMDDVPLQGDHLWANGAASFGSTGPPSPSSQAGEAATAPLPRLSSLPPSFRSTTPSRAAGSGAALPGSMRERSWSPPAAAPEAANEAMSGYRQGISGPGVDLSSPTPGDAEASRGMGTARESSHAQLHPQPPQQAPPECVVLDSDLGVVQRKEDFVDPMELDEVLHQLRGAELGAPAPPPTVDMPIMADNIVEDPEDPPAAGAAIIASTRA